MRAKIVPLRGLFQCPWLWGQRLIREALTQAVQPANSERSTSRGFLNADRHQRVWRTGPRADLDFPEDPPLSDGGSGQPTGDERSASVRLASPVPGRLDLINRLVILVACKLAPGSHNIGPAGRAESLVIDHRQGEVGLSRETIRV